MAANQTIDITALIDDRKVDRFNAKLVIFCFFIILFDGYDIGAAAFAGPSLVKEWGVTSMAALGPVFSASLFGILFGSPIFGWIGDRYGRNKAIVGSCLVIGVFTFSAMWAHSLDQLMYLRFFAGVGIGEPVGRVEARDLHHAVQPQLAQRAVGHVKEVIEVQEVLKAKGRHEQGRVAHAGVERH